MGRLSIIRRSPGLFNGGNFSGCAQSASNKNIIHGVYGYGSTMRSQKCHQYKNICVGAAVSMSASASSRSSTFRASSCSFQNKCNISSRTLGTSARTSSKYRNHFDLHHEWILDGKIAKHTVDLDFHSKGTVVFLHGLLGSGKNLRTLAKKLSQETGISALLFDLRGHGQSKPNANANASESANVDMDSLHSIYNCSMDVVQTLENLNLVGDKSPIGIVGHSFGGRTALSYHHALLQRQEQTNNNNNANANANANVLPPKHCWILDSCPGKAHASVAGVIDAVSSIPMPIGSKQELVTKLREKDISKPIASWMTTNLKKIQDTNENGSGTHSEGFEFMFDLNVVRGILNDFPRQDMLQQLQYCCTAVSTSPSPSPSMIHKVIAGKNQAWTSDVLKVLEDIQRKSDGENISLNLVTLDTGHWVHTEDLDGLVRVMVKTFQ